jgi:hypothetical protein
MPLDLLETTSDVMDALGGNGAVAALTDSKPSAVSNWRSFETFPPNTYVVMTQALAAIGKEAPTSLWRMKVPAEASS